MRLQCSTTERTSKKDASYENIISEAKDKFVEELAQGKAAVFPTEYVDGKEAAKILLRYKFHIKQTKKD